MLISVITICFNNLEALLATLQSIDKQILKPYEHWIIDGSSDGKIKEYLETHHQPLYRKWVSERDRGIADAFNKGISRSAGEIVNMLNAGDCYYSEQVLATVTTTFKTNTDMMWLHGKYQLQRGGLWVTIGKPFEAGKLYRGMRSLSHQSMFVKKALHHKYGWYDITLKNAMDYDFVCRIRKENFAFLAIPLVVFAPGGTTDTNYLTALKEGEKVYRRYFGSSLQLTLWQYRLKLLHYVLNSSIGKLLYKIKVRLKLENI